MHKFFILLLMPVIAASCSNKPDEIIISGNELLYVYPNPVHVEVYVSIRNASGTVWTLQFLDANGKIMKEEIVPQGDHDFRFNLQDEPPGHYHVILNTGHDKYTREVVKIAK